MEEAVQWIPTKPKAKFRVPWESQVETKKRDNFEKCALTEISNPTNSNAQKLKKSQRKPTNTYQKKKKNENISKAKSIKLEVR